MKFLNRRRQAPQQLLQQIGLDNGDFQVALEVGKKGRYGNGKAESGAQAENEGGTRERCKACVAHRRAFYHDRRT